MKTISQSALGIWLSGFFGAAALVHMVRGLLRYEVIIDGYNVPLNLSFAMFAIFAVLSGIVGYMGCRASSCEDK